MNRAWVVGVGARGSLNPNKAGNDHKSAEEGSSDHELIMFKLYVIVYILQKSFQRLE